jgi:hypothetical protein
MNLLLGFFHRAPHASRSRALRRFYRTLRRKDTAEARATRLLRHWLSTEQRAQFDAMNFFDVVGCSTGKRYRIHYGRLANVQEIGEAGDSKMGLCADGIKRPHDSGSTEAPDDAGACCRSGLSARAVFPQPFTESRHAVRLASAAARTVRARHGEANDKDCCRDTTGDGTGACRLHG